MSTWKKTPYGKWFFEFDCEHCADSGVVGWSREECFACGAHLLANAQRVRTAIETLQGNGREIETSTVQVAQMLVSASADNPIPGDALAYLLSTDTRRIKSIVRVLRDEWSLPVCARREKPHGYFIAANVGELLEWSRVTRSQAVSELATMHRLQRKCFPEFFEQGELAFVSAISDELVEALR